MHDIYRYIYIYIYIYIYTYGYKKDIVSPAIYLEIRTEGMFRASGLGFRVWGSTLLGLRGLKELGT